MLLSRTVGPHGTARVQPCACSRLTERVSGVPPFLIDDALIGHKRRDKLIGFGRARDRFAGPRILDVEASVLHIDADVQFIADYPALVLAADDALKIPALGSGR